MATADEPIMSLRSFAILIIVIFSFVFVTSLYPIAFRNLIADGFDVVKWIFVHLPVGWIFLIGLLGTTALIIIGGAIMAYEKLTGSGA